MQISTFSTGGFVAHKYRIPGIKSKFSVWFDRDGFALEAERIDRAGRSFPIPEGSPAWRHIARHKLAGLEGETEIAAYRAKHG